MLTITSESIQKTQKLGEIIGKYAPEETILAFSGDLGSGKTTLIQGIARGIGVPKEYYITSPTYTLVHEYPARVPFYHMDLYRLPDGMDIEEMGFSDIFNSKGVIAMEWSEKLNLNASFKEYLSIEITFGKKEERLIHLTAYGQNAADLIKNVENNPF